MAETIWKFELSEVCNRLMQIVCAVKRLPRGVCPVCGNEYRLRATGTLGAHRRRTPQGHRGAICPSVDQPPVSTTIPGGSE